MGLLLVRALWALIDHDFYLSRHDFAALHARVHAVPVIACELRPGDIDTICRTVSYACIWYTHPVLCLQRAAVTVTLLRRFGVQAEMVIGTQRLPLKAHAWVEVNGRVVNDRPEVQTNYLVMERC